MHFVTEQTNLRYKITTIKGETTKNIMSTPLHFAIREKALNLILTT